MIIKHISRYAILILWEAGNPLYAIFSPEIVVGPPHKFGRAGLDVQSCRDLRVKDHGQLPEHQSRLARQNAAGS